MLSIYKYRCLPNNDQKPLQDTPVNISISSQGHGYFYMDHGLSMSNVVIDFVVKDGSLFIRIKQKQLQCLRVTLRCIYVNCRLSKCDHFNHDSYTQTHCIYVSADTKCN